MVTQRTVLGDLFIEKMRPIVDLFEHAQHRPRNQVESLDMHPIIHGLLIEQNGPGHKVPMNLFIGHKEHINLSQMFLHPKLPQPITHIDHMPIQRRHMFRQSIQLAILTEIPNEDLTVGVVGRRGRVVLDLDDVGAEGEQVVDGQQGGGVEVAVALCLGGGVEGGVVEV